MNGEEGGEGAGENPRAAADRGLDKLSSNKAMMNMSADSMGTDIYSEEEELENLEESEHSQKEMQELGQRT